MSKILFAWEMGANLGHLTRDQAEWRSARQRLLADTGVLGRSGLAQ